MYVYEVMKLRRAMLSTYEFAIIFFVRCLFFLFSFVD